MGRQQRKEDRQARKKTKISATQSHAKSSSGGSNGVGKQTSNAGFVFNKNHSIKAYMRELRKVVDNADVLLEVVDARDPLGCRSLETERMLLRAGKKIVLILNKIDLVPKSNVEAWLRYLRHDFPTLAFKPLPISTNQSLSRCKCRQLLQIHTNTATAGADVITGGSEAIGAGALLQLIKNYSRSLNMKTSMPWESLVTRSKSIGERLWKVVQMAGGKEARRELGDSERVQRFGRRIQRVLVSPRVSVPGLDPHADDVSDIEDHAPTADLASPSNPLLEHHPLMETHGPTNSRQKHGHIQTHRRALFSLLGRGVGPDGSKHRRIRRKLKKMKKRADKAVLACSRKRRKERRVVETGEEGTGSMFDVLMEAQDMDSDEEEEDTSATTAAAAAPAAAAADDYEEEL
ncbi:uncharacterized protein UTRI_02446 [Ustilago trichophora]|uniref:Guanine nucleotide-binding protein-like 3 N-terminal domain-containing protein n=1 Tax=Ustilago trichophora TaxID=86804 RepID=A0A5C3E7Q9_9BASI|nr:uncharacterized protein UTRI_02446 [Ustilago trichophora]